MVAACFWIKKTKRKIQQGVAQEVVWRIRRLGGIRMKGILKFLLNFYVVLEFCR